MKKLNPLNYFLCGYCKKKINPETARRVYKYTGFFHFLCKSCQKLPFEEVGFANTCFYYTEIDGKVINHIKIKNKELKK